MEKTKKFYYFLRSDKQALKIKRAYYYNYDYLNLYDLNCKIKENDKIMNGRPYLKKTGI